MINKPLRRALCAACLSASAFLSSLTAEIVTSVAEWNDYFAASYGASHVPLKSYGITPDSDQYAWAGHRWIEAYLALAQTTGSSTYMDKAREIIDHMISQRDDIRFASSTLTPEYWSAPRHYLINNGTPAPGWRRIQNSKSAVSPLIDGRICESIILWCELARRGFPQYETVIAGYLPLVKESLDLHLPALFEVPSAQTIPSGNFYNPVFTARAFKYWRDESQGEPTLATPETWSGHVPVNHVCTFARAMLGYDHLSGTTTYQTQVQGAVNYFLNALDPARPSIAVWMYSPLDPSSMNVGKMEDVDHATVTLALVAEAYRVGGYGVDGAHVARLVETFHTFYDTGTKGVSYYIDGSGISDAGGSQTAAIGAKSWLWLSQFDPTIAAKVRDSYEYHFDDSHSAWVMAGWANLLYWESLLDSTAAFDDSSIGTPGPQTATRPLYTDAVNLLKWPYHSNATSSEPATGGFEGAKHRVIDYSVANWQWSFVQFSFSPVENGAAWGGVRLAYKTTGSAVFSLTLSDGSNTMTATLPAQSAYASRTLHWSDFANQSAVNKASLATVRLIANGVANATGTVSFDDLRLVEAPAVRPLYTDTVDLLKWPSHSNTTSSELTTGGFEGVKHRVVNYTVANWQWALAQYSFSPAENGAAWGGLSVAYKTTGSAVFSLTLSDGSNTMTATLPAQSVYAARTLYWSDFSNHSAVNKSSLTTLRFIANGVASATGTVSFDDLKLVE